VLSHANHSKQAQRREWAQLTLVLTVEFNESRSNGDVPRLIERGTVEESERSVGQRASMVPL
jgi:hypothetical protein